MKVFIGYDSREPDAFAVAANSILRRATCPTTVTALKSDRLAEHGLLRRPTDLRGQRYDIPSNAPASTEFAISRFLVPFLAHSGWALFADSDIVCLADVAELRAIADPRFAVMVVKHQHEVSGGTKMDGQAQIAYPRKNWSSVVLWNVDHPANKRLSLVDVQERRGFDLHQFYWLNDAEIGELPAEWNWLVGVQDKPAVPKIAHFTLGGPFLPTWNGGEHDELWYSEFSQLPKKAG